MRIARIVIDKATPSYDKEYDYHIPDNAKVSQGCRVVVPFGRMNSRRLGFITDIYNVVEKQPKLKEIYSIVDSVPVVNFEGIQMLKQLKELTFCSYFDAVRCMVPPGIGVNLSVGIVAVKQTNSNTLPQLSLDANKIYETLLTKRKITDEYALLCQLDILGSSAVDELIEYGLVMRGQLVKRKIGDKKAVMARVIDHSSTTTPKQQEVVDFLTQMDKASIKEICYYCSVTKVVIDNLVKKGILELFEEIIYSPSVEVEQQVKPVILNDSQQSAFETLKKDINSGYCVSLLYGVTGSGKTQVFIKLIEENIKYGLGVIVMVPEISLTPQTVNEFTSRFGERVAVLHSSLSMGERLDQWRKVKDGICDIVVGTRLAVFAPLKKIGLIVMDEEHEHTYHSESSPRYHARDIAKLRCNYHGANLLLCSATPSIESYYMARQGKYNLVELNNRYSGNGLPQVVMVNLKDSPPVAGSSVISGELYNELLVNLNNGEQSILLLNRRGYNTTIKCLECFTPAKCPNCSISLTYHTANEKLMCHYCGYVQHKNTKCQFCDNTMTIDTGAGTQKVEQELIQLFPNARVLRMDMDTTMAKFSHQRLFDSFSSGEYDIMIGTQMVAKGLNFPKVTLVGVLSADQALYNDDFRAYEKTFSLITQVVGRCGRGELPGRAYIQTYSPDHEVITLAAMQDYKGYYSSEISFRKVGLYPPICDLCCVAFVNENEVKAKQDAEEFSKQFALIASKQYPQLPIRVLGSSEFPVFKAAGKFRYRLLIKCKNNKTTRLLLTQLLEWYNKKSNDSFCYVDMYSNC